MFEIKKCLVKGCENHNNQGEFIGDLCMPCHVMLTTGNLGHGDTFIHHLNDVKEEPPIKKEKCIKERMACPKCGNYDIGYFLHYGMSSIEINMCPDYNCNTCHYKWCI